MFKEKARKVKIIDIKAGTSSLSGKPFWSILFMDGKTYRVKELDKAPNFKKGDKVEVIKVGSGLYAGYRFPQ